MLKEVVVKLMLVLTGNIAATIRDCSYDIPTSCMTSTNIQLTMETDHYDLQLCSNGQCIPAAGQEKWISCNRMCDTCESIAKATYCGTDEVQCESRVSAFLDNYCSSNTPSTSTLTQTTTLRSTVTTTTRIHTTTTQRVTLITTQVVTTTLPRQTVTRTTAMMVTQQLTTTVTASQTCNDTNPDKYTQARSATTMTISVSDSPVNSNNQEMISSVNATPLAVLGGVVIVLLLLTITGWVWAVVLVKKKKTERTK